MMSSALYSGHNLHVRVDLYLYVYKRVHLESSEVALK